MFLQVSHIFVAGKAHFSNGSFSPHVIRWDFRPVDLSRSAVRQQKAQWKGTKAGT